MPAFGLTRPAAALAPAAVLALATALLAVAAPSASASPAASGAGAPAEPPADVSLLHYPCGTSAPTDYDSVVGYPRTDGLNMRTGSGVTCPSNGQAQRGDRLDYHCYTVNRHGDRWTYVRNVRTGVAGWVDSSLISYDGSMLWCER
ncbi:SH3 domain-containing protein [Streptomonospora sp. S1-112]|uniref:SH3 domain-containing protein n=1 Tax=Streptomonospora mangrovi TaxID=2883123 RepID=A0A9X3SEK5_9ACTN|nr:SH3 domain-containing protein [Streptomonospora mangrovi]MDA0563865.1 SH3 domain-containing protein [Streptomonospora mangrovi]